MASSASDFTEPEFLEYDPTPYGGGYDIAGTYGKPLPPSDAICYPHSVSKPKSPQPSLNGLSNNGSVTPTNGKGMVDEATSPQVQAGPYADDKEEEPWSGYCNGNWLNDSYSDYWGGNIFANGYGIRGSDHGYDYGKPESDQGDNTYSGNEVPQHGYDYYPCGRQNSNSQFGYNRDDLGPCAALFDYWPCLYRKEEKSSYVQHDDEENCYGSQWKGAAEYFFGSLNATGERREEAVSYGYQKHYPEQPYTVQLLEYNEQSWNQNMSFCEAYHEEPYEESNYSRQKEAR